MAQRIRGPRGTAVRLTVRRPGAGQREISVVRERVDLSGVAYPLQSGVLPGTSVACFLFPRSASPALAYEVPQALDALGGKARLRGLILDLRICGAGSFPLEELLSYFTTGSLGTAYTAEDARQIVIQGQDYAGSQSIPLAVLVGPDTEGAAEILAGALQSVGRALVVGYATFGSVEREQQFGLVDGSRLWMPVWSYRAPGGRELGMEGVVPDRITNADWDSVSELSDPVRELAARELAAGWRR